MTKTAWVIYKDGTTIIVVSESRFLVARPDPSGVTKQEMMEQYLGKLSGNLNQSICRIYQLLGKLYGNLLNKLRIANVI